MAFCRRDVTLILATNTRQQWFLSANAEDSMFLYSHRFLQVTPILTRNLTMPCETASNKAIENAIRQKLNCNLNPAHLNVINESYMHNVPKGSETHFKVIVVSDKFENIPQLQRHKMVNDLLKYELKNGVHALSIVAKTPNQWSGDHEVMPSPRCLGGEK